MEEDHPPWDDGNTIREQNDGDVTHSVTTAAKNIPDVAIEPHWTEKETLPADVSP